MPELPELPRRSVSVAAVRFPCPAEGCLFAALSVSGYTQHIKYRHPEIAPHKPGK